MRRFPTISLYSASVTAALLFILSQSSLFLPSVQAASTKSHVTMSWGTPIYTTMLFPTKDKNVQMNAALHKLALALEQTTRSVYKSNVGGFQSQTFDKLNPHNSLVLKELEEEIIEKAKEFYLLGLDHAYTSDGGQRQAAFQDEEDDSLELFTIWMNVNRPHHYNIAHTHSDCFLSGVYYVTTGRPSNDPESPAALLLSDPRSQVSTTYDYAGWFGMQKNEIKEPKPGMLILFPSWLTHRVEPVGMDEKERVSVSFNVQLRHPTALEKKRRKGKGKESGSVVEESDL